MGLKSMSEIISTTTVEHENQETDRIHVRAALGSLSLEHAADLIASFHGAESHHFGRPLDQSSAVNSIVSKNNEQGQRTNEVVGRGEDIEQALYDTFMAMRRLETVKTKPLMRMEIQKGVDVDFTNLEHYAPKVAPTTEAYSIPEHLQGLLDGNKLSRDTYNNTVEVEGWDAQLFAQVEQFTRTEQGAGIVQSLKINSLQTLTPEQAVKLTLSMVQGLSKYSRNERGEQDDLGADQVTTMELMEQGLTHSSDPSWSGNGVCRNIASNVKAVFEAIKMNQSSVNMLHNTYAGYTGSFEDFRSPKRWNAGAGSDPNQGMAGHAWNTFTTIDGRGDASTTVVDVTWSLQKSSKEAIKSMDYTLTRSARMARELFEKSDDKSKSFPDLNDYYRDFMNDGFKKYRGTSEFDAMAQFVMKEYLDAANVAINAEPEWALKQMPQAPNYIQGAAYRLGDNLGKAEVGTLSKLSDVHAIDNFDGILRNYVQGGKNTTMGVGNRAEQLTFADNELSQKVIGMIGVEKIKAYADASTVFRIQARRHSPDSLSPFDAENFNDRRELAELARQNKLRLVGDNPSTIARMVDNGLLKAANGDRSLIARMTVGQDLYTLVQNYPQLTGTLSQTR